MSSHIPVVGLYATGTLREGDNPDNCMQNLRVYFRNTKNFHLYYPQGVYGLAAYDAVKNVLIGWIPKARYDEFLPKVSTSQEYIFNTRFSTPNGQHYGALFVAAEKMKPITPVIPPGEPIKEKKPMNVQFPSLQAILANNTSALGTASKLELGHVANQQLGKIVSKRFKGKYSELINTPVGQLALANAAGVLVRSLQPTNKMAISLVDAMLVDSYQQVARSLDLNGLINDLLNCEEVKQALEGNNA